jgi:hypothetical protein
MPLLFLHEGCGTSFDPECRKECVLVGEWIPGERCEVEDQALWETPAVSPADARAVTASATERAKNSAARLPSPSAFSLDQADEVAVVLQL